MRTYGKTGLLTESQKIIIGSHGSLSEQEFGRGLSWLRISNSAILVEVNHTHPAYEFNLEGDRGGKAFIAGRRSPLSASDIDFLRDVSYRNPALYWRIRAILPNGYNYQLTMKAGRIVNDPFASTP